MRCQPEYLIPSAPAGCHINKASANADTTTLSIFLPPPLNDRKNRGDPHDCQEMATTVLMPTRAAKRAALSGHHKIASNSPNAIVHSITILARK